LRPKYCADAVFEKRETKEKKRTDTHRCRVEFLSLIAIYLKVLKSLLANNEPFDSLRFNNAGTEEFLLKTILKNCNLPECRLIYT
jgi:hypothetical protein